MIATEKDPAWLAFSAAAERPASRVEHTVFGEYGSLYAYTAGSQNTDLNYFTKQLFTGSPEGPSLDGRISFSDNEEGGPVVIYKKQRSAGGTDQLVFGLENREGKLTSYLIVNDVDWNRVTRKEYNSWGALFGEIAQLLVMEGRGKLIPVDKMLPEIESYKVQPHRADTINK